jgi:hypothetical protein
MFVKLWEFMDGIHGWNMGDTVDFRDALNHGKMGNMMMKIDQFKGGMPILQTQSFLEPRKALPQPDMG